MKKSLIYIGLFLLCFNRPEAEEKPTAFINAKIIRLPEFLTRDEVSLQLRFALLFGL